MYINPNLADRLVAGRQAELERVAAACRGIRASRPQRSRLAARIRKRVGWWLIGQGLHLLSSAPATPGEP